MRAARRVVGAEKKRTVALPATVLQRRDDGSTRSDPLLLTLELVVPQEGPISPTRPL